MSEKQIIAIIDYEMGNIGSIENAVKHLECKPLITRKVSDINRADKLILPGVGAFRQGFQNLKKFDLISVLEENVIKQGKPILGICLGMQLLSDEGFEDGISNGLGWIPGIVKRIPDKNFRVPHIGWNNILIKDESTLFNQLNKDLDLDFYFIHSYYFHCTDYHNVKASCEYGVEFAAIIQKNNIYGMQFHPEKSHRNGLIILYNFLYENNDNMLNNSHQVVDNILENAISDDRLHSC